jgi:hypothetical protein
MEVKFVFGSLQPLLDDQYRRSRDISRNGACRMKTQYRIGEDDYARMARLHAWRHFIARPSARQLVIIAIIVILFAAAVSVRPWIAPVIALALAVVAVRYLSAIFVICPNRARHHYRQYKGIQEPITVELSEDGLRFSSTDGESILPWPKILQWRQNAQFILIYRMPVMYHMVPKSLASEGFDIALLVNRLAEHVGPER